MSNFAEMSLPRKTWESVGGAVVVGAVTGVLLGVSAWAYVAAVVVSVVGGVPAGSQHRTLAGALVRGGVAGVVWAVVVLGVHAVTGATAALALPHPPVLLVVISAVVTAAVAAGSWWVASKRHAAVGHASVS